MNKNYYDVLQINRNASPEIIEKAYKVLAKKYHPDLQAQENKKQAEEILKEINEAYEILSNPEKKKEYDFLLLQNEKVNFDDFSENSSTNCSVEDDLRTNGTDKIPKEDFFQNQQQELLHKQQLEQQRIQQEQIQRQQELAYQEQLQQARQKAYHDAYIQDLKNRGYKIRYRKSLKDYVRILFTFVVVILVLFLLWQLPFVKNFFVRLYEENNIVHYVVDLFSNLFFH